MVWWRPVNVSDLSSQLLHQKAAHTKPCLTAHFELVTSAGHSMCSIISLQTADDHQNHLRPQKNSRIFSTAQIRFKWHEAVTSFQRKGSSFIFGHVVSEENNTGVGMGFIWARPLSLTQASGLKHQTKHQNYLACDHSLCASSLWVHVDLVLLYAPMCFLDFANSYNSLSSGSVFGSLGPASCD